jgi:hypothetical protein
MRGFVIGSLPISVSARQRLADLERAFTLTTDRPWISVFGVCKLALRGLSGTFRRELPDGRWVLATMIGGREPMKFRMQPAEI